MEVEENQSMRNFVSLHRKSEIFESFSEPQKSKIFEVIGICNICRKAGKMYTCSLCGNIVCKDCYGIAKGICKSCKRNPGKTI